MAKPAVWEYLGPYRVPPFLQEELTALRLVPSDGTT